MLGKESSPEIAHSWSGVFQAKLSFGRKFIFVKVETLGQRGFKIIFLALPQVRELCPQGWVAEGTHQGCTSPSFTALFFPYKKILKVSFLLDTEWKAPLEMSGVFHKWHFFFPDWLWTTSSYTLFASPHPSWCCVLRIATFCPLMVHLELEHMGNCSAAILNLICQCRVCINAANPASGYGSLNSSLQPQE